MLIVRKYNTAYFLLLLVQRNTFTASLFIADKATASSTLLELTARKGVLPNSSPPPNSISLLSPVTSKRYHIVTKLKMAHMDSPSAQRNKEPIWSVLRKIISSFHDSNSPLEVLEIAAGAGVHTLHFTTQIVAELNKNVVWYPSDPEEKSRNSIQDKVDSCSDQKVKESIHVPPLSLTLIDNGILEYVSHYNNGCVIQDETLDLILCINMIHISPWDATIGLFKVAAQKLKGGGVLYCYGPYKINGTAVDSNL